ncbi:MAG: DUF3842 family protein [Treponema sp.]|jgi:hypothetical protein|nr:DUF3842 family protein [Treponema sp.]
MKRTIVIVDGMGGGIGTQLIGRIREFLDKDWPGEWDLVALGTNSAATERMVKAGAHRGATGENALKRSVGQGAFILGPVGIVLPNSLMGEISPAMAAAVLDAPALRILVPIQQDHFILAGFEPLSLGKMVERAVEILREKIAAGKKNQASGIPWDRGAAQ